MYFFQLLSDGAKGIAELARDIQYDIFTTFWNVEYNSSDVEDSNLI